MSRGNPLGEDDIWDYFDQLRKKKTPPFAPILPPLTPKPNPLDDTIKEILRHAKFRCNACNKTVETDRTVNSPFRFCPYCGSQQIVVDDVDAIRQLLELLNSKISKYLDRKLDKFDSTKDTS